MRRLNLMYLCKSVLVVCSLFSVAVQGQTTVRMVTSLGNIDVELYDTAAPITVANFLNYVYRGRYDGTFIHRNVPGFIIQGGGYSFSTGALAAVSAYPPIVNEYDPSRSNLRGTIAMAKLPSGPDTATSEWFFNLADNSANLDNQNGGFTVFGEVLGGGMDNVDAIAALTTVYCSSTFDTLPLLPGLATCPNTTQLQYLVVVSSVSELPYVPGYKVAIVDYAGNVVSLNAFVSPATLTNVVVSDNPSLASTPNGVTFSEGFFDFQVGNFTSGGSTVVMMQLPTGYLPNTYYMYGPTPDNNSPHWYEFKFDGQTGAEFSGNTVALHFVDGERGDADLTANSQISNLGAPAISSNASIFSREDAGSLSWGWLLMLGLPLFISRIK